MAANRITKKWFQNHMAYSWWKYLLVVIISIMGVNVAFTMTAYRVPDNKKIELYMCNGYTDAVKLQQALAPQFLAAYPEQEEFVVMNIDLTSEDMYANMQFTTYIAAQQGDVMLLPESEVRKLSAEGAEEVFIELTPYIESGVIRADDLDLSRGMLKKADGTQGLYAIPADSLYGLLDYYCMPQGGMLCIMSYSGNEEHAAAVLNMLLETYRTDKPEGYDAALEDQQSQTTIFN